MTRKFAFVSKAAEKEYKNHPSDVIKEFGVSLRAVQENKKPFLPIKDLNSSVGQGVFELIINGSPAFRCLYIAKFENTVFVIHSFEKTTNHVDKKAMKTAKQRYKKLMEEIRILKKKGKK